MLRNQKVERRKAKLESGIKGFGKKVTEKVTKPITSLFDTIINFFKNIFLGNALLRDSLSSLMIHC